MTCWGFLMSDLAGRGPLGQKQPKQKKKTRKAVRKVSKKRAEYNASPARQDAIDHMARVKMLDCVICQKEGPNDAHHVKSDGMPRNDLRVIPLCFWCHRGPRGYHADKASWVARHGPDTDYLAAVAALLAT